MATTGQIEQLAAQILARFDTVQTVDAMADDFAQLGSKMPIASSLPW